MAGDEELVPLHDVHLFIKAPCQSGLGLLRHPWVALAASARWRDSRSCGRGLVGRQRFGAYCPSLLPPTRWCVLVELLSEACGLGSAAVRRPFWGCLSAPVPARFRFLCCSLAKLPLAPLRLGGALFQGSYLVDPASSHMLVSKIKPCMSKYKLLIL